MELPCVPKFPSSLACLSRTDSRAMAVVAEARFNTALSWFVESPDSFKAALDTARGYITGPLVLAVVLGDHSLATNILTVVCAEDAAPDLHEHLTTTAGYITTRHVDLHTRSYV